MFFFSFFACSTKVGSTTIVDHGFGSEFFIHNVGRNNQIKGEDLNVIPAWENKLSGENTHITVVDGGCRLTNTDFENKFEQQDNYNFITKSNDTFTNANQSKIGTAVLGLAAAALNNKGIVGVAPDAKVSCVAFDTNHKFIKDTEMQTYISEKTKKSSILAIPFLMMGPKPFLPNIQIQNKMKTLATADDVVIVNSAGNSGHLGGDVNQYAATCSPYAITVGSVTVRGAPTYYTNNGACISVASPNSGNTDSFPEEMANYPMIAHPSSDDDELLDVSHGDNSFAVGPISGVAALMKEANPSLKPLDIQLIMQLTATKTDPNSPLWKKNAAGNFYHPQIGFGRADAALACEVAKKWTNNLKLDESKSSFSSVAGLKIGSGNEKPAFVNFKIEKDIQFTSYVELQINTSNVDLSFAHIEVESPQGSKFTVLYPSLFAEAHNEHVISVKQSVKSKMTIGIRCFLGEKAQGTWKVYVKYSNFYPEVVIHDASLTVYGFDSITIPSFQKKTGQPSEMPYELLNSTEWVDFTHKVKCDAVWNLNLSVQSYENFEHIPVPIYIVNKADASRALIGHINATGAPGTQTFKVPCTYAAGEYGFSMLFENTLFQISKNFTLINSFHPQLKKPPPHLTLKSNPLFIQWSKKLHKPKPTGIFQKVLVSIYDNDHDKMIFSKYIDDNGHQDVNVPEVNCMDCVFSLASVYETDSNEYFEAPIYLRFKEGPTTKPPTPREPRTPSAVMNGTAFLTISAIGWLAVAATVGFFVWRRKRQQLDYLTVYGGQLAN